MKEKGHRLALQFQEKVRRLGSDSRIVGNDRDIDWMLVFPQSLLGLYQQPAVIPDMEILTPQERKLKELKLPDINIAAFADYDGVLVSPVYDFPGCGDIKEETRVGFEGLLAGAKYTFLRTSRFVIPDDWLGKSDLLRSLTYLFREKSFRFPILDEWVAAQFQEKGEDKLTVIHKPLISGSKDLITIIKWLAERVDLDKTVFYMFISSQKDRREAIALLKTLPHLAGHIVFFDTGHVFL